MRTRTFITPPIIPLHRRWTRIWRCSNARSKTTRSAICSGKVRAKAYDAVINGYECAGGSIRIHQKDIQALNFKALGLSQEKARERFGFFLDALEYGTPPHGGFAAGIERTCMILCGTENIRDVMAFPKTASAQDLMMDSPGDVGPCAVG